jgi:hypothetical protein
LCWRKPLPPSSRLKSNPAGSRQQADFNCLSPLPLLPTPSSSSGEVVQQSDTSHHTLQFTMARTKSDSLLAHSPHSLQTVIHSTSHILKSPAGSWISLARTAKETLLGTILMFLLGYSLLWKHVYHVVAQQWVDSLGLLFRLSSIIPQHIYIKHK